jgi:hypothetical protein
MRQKLTAVVVLSVGLGAAIGFGPADQGPQDQAAPARPVGGNLDALEPLAGEWIIKDDASPPGEFNRSTFEWKGGKTCLQYKSFRTTAGKESPEDEGLFVWDGDKRVIRELTVDRIGQFNSGVWTPDGKQLIGAFETFAGRGAARPMKHRLILEFIDKDTCHLWPVMGRDEKPKSVGKPIVFKRKGAEARP